MRAPLVLLTSALTAAAAVFVCDAVRATPPSSGATKPGADVTALEARVAALEARSPGAPAARADAGLAARVASLESRIAGAPRAEEASPGSAAGPVAPGASATPGEVSAPAGQSPSPESISEAEVARFRRVQEVADAQREKERTLAGLDALVARLGLQLTPAQKERLAAETVAYRAKLREVFPGGPGGPGGPFGGGGGRPSDDVLTAAQEVQRGFVTKLEEFLPASDAASIATALTPGPRGRGPGGGMGGDGAPVPR